MWIWFLLLIFKYFTSFFNNNTIQNKLHSFGKLTGFLLLNPLLRFYSLFMYTYQHVLRVCRSKIIAKKLTTRNNSCLVLLSSMCTNLYISKSPLISCFTKLLQGCATTLFDSFHNFCRYTCYNNIISWISLFTTTLWVFWTTSLILRLH